MKNSILLLLLVFTSFIGKAQEPYVEILLSMNQLKGDTTQYTIQLYFDCNYEKKKRSDSVDYFIQKEDSAYYKGEKLAGHETIYTIQITDSRENQTMILRFMKPNSLMSSVNINKVQFRSGYFEIDLISTDNENQFYVVSNEYSWNKVNFNKRKLRTKRDKSVKQQLTKPKAN